jgi:hypothetical protein
MKYPWVAISLAIIWFSTTYMILKREDMDVSTVLFVALAGTLIIAVIGLRAPKIKS